MVYWSQVISVVSTGLCGLCWSQVIVWVSTGLCGLSRSQVISVVSTGLYGLYWSLWSLLLYWSWWSLLVSSDLCSLYWSLWSLLVSSDLCSLYWSLWSLLVSSDLCWSLWSHLVSSCLQWLSSGLASGGFTQLPRPQWSLVHYHLGDWTPPLPLVWEASSGFSQCELDCYFLHSTAFMLNP